jgi:hypothetical protein
MYELIEPVWQVIDHWQTLIAGLLALAAGVITVVATKKSANREIAAAQEQTKAAQHQTEVTREIERRRIAREEYAFHTMLEAAMAAVIEDVETTRKLWSSLPTDTHSPQAYAARQRVKRAGFAELRGAFLRFGGPLTERFLRLDKEIDDYSSRWITRFNPVNSTSQNIGVSEGLHPQLDSIERQATTLHNEAAGGVKLCRDELAKQLVDLEL